MQSQPPETEPTRVLVVEDQPTIAKLLRQSLNGALVDQTTLDGLHTPLTSLYDALVVDIKRTEYEGDSTVADLRRTGVTIPIIALTYPRDALGCAHCLEQGADDCLTRPFPDRELVARLRLRIGEVAALPVIKVGDLTMNLINREVRRGNRRLALRAREFELLEYFMRSPGTVHRKSQIVEDVWNVDFNPASNIVAVTVSRLRRKVDHASNVKLITSIRSGGYGIRDVTQSQE